MTVIDRSALLPFSAAQLFSLVNDIEAYPQYMEGCVGAEVLSQAGNVMEARLDLAAAGIKQSFSTRNVLSHPSEITLELLDGPFDHLRGRWEFRALQDTACKMHLNLAFSMQSTLLGAAAAKLFDRVANNLVDAVSRRAADLYGTNPVVGQ